MTPQTTPRRFVLTSVAAGIVARPFNARAEDAFTVFRGKSSAQIAFEQPTSWTTAIDRALETNAVPIGGKTVVLVGNFRSVDTVAVRMERAGESARAAAARGDAAGVAEALTANERDAVRALEAVGVVGGVENGRTGTMGFALYDDARTRVDERGRQYFTYAYETKVCRGNIEEEGLGGVRVCVGPKGDYLDVINRKNLVVCTFLGDDVVKLHASAVSSRFDEPEVNEVLRRAADSFALIVA